MESKVIRLKYDVSRFAPNETMVGFNSHCQLYSFEVFHMERNAIFLFFFRGQYLFLSKIGDYTIFCAFGKREGHAENY